MVEKLIVYRSWTLPDVDFYNERDAKLAEIQQQIHMLTAGATNKSYTLRTQGIRDLLDEYDRIYEEKYETPIK